MQELVLMMWWVWQHPRTSRCEHSHWWLQHYKQSTLTACVELYICLNSTSLITLRAVQEMLIVNWPLQGCGFNTNYCFVWKSFLFPWSDDSVFWFFFCHNHVIESWCTCAGQVMHVHDHMIMHDVQYCNQTSLVDSWTPTWWSNYQMRYGDHDVNNSGA